MTLWDADRLVSEARAADGLQDFGGQGYREPLERLLRSLEQEARLNKIGETVLRQRLLDILTTRLRVAQYVRRYPEILDEEISRPLLIVGLPRSGTTMLHRTIAADHRMFAPLWFETRYPCPTLEWDPSGCDTRIADAQAEMQAMLNANPELLAVHPMDALGADEDIMLLEQSFYSYNLQAFANLPAFDAWIEVQDHTPGYEYLKLLLQFLQWQKKKTGQTAQGWVIKAPHHLHFMDLVFKVFPDARVVQSHRDPLETIPSLASMTAGLWRIYSDSADPAECARQWARKFAGGLNHTMDVREAMGDERFLDLWFADTVNDPLAEISRVYDFLDLELTAEARAEMTRWQEFNRRELRPPHEYTLEQFGFTQQGLEQQFARYRADYILDRARS